MSPPPTFYYDPRGSSVLTDPCLAPCLFLTRGLHLYVHVSPLLPGPAGIASYVQYSCAGFLMQKELDHLALDNAERPLAAIIGGAKVSTKLPVIQSLLAKWCVIR
jgi:hypothetical protein